MAPAMLFGKNGSWLKNGQLDRNGIFTHKELVHNFSSFILAKVSSLHWKYILHNIFNLKTIWAKGGGRNLEKRKCCSPEASRAISQPMKASIRHFLADLFSEWNLWCSLITSSTTHWWMAPAVPLFWIGCDTCISFELLSCCLHRYVGSLVAN